MRAFIWTILVSKLIAIVLALLDARLTGRITPTDILCIVAEITLVAWASVLLFGAHA